MAPEVIKGEESLDEERGGIDYWSLGVVIFMIYSRKNPFDAETIDETIENILENRINWDLLAKTKIEHDLVDLLRRFLAFEPSERLKDIELIKKHPYFKSKLTFLTLTL